MKVIKKPVRRLISKNGKEVNIYRIASEFNENQTDVKKEKFDIKLSDVKKIYDRLVEKGEKFIMHGLNPMRMCLISDIDGNFVYKDTQEYMNGKDNGIVAFEDFSQLRVTIYDK